MADTQIAYILPGDIEGVSAGLYGGSLMIRNQNLMRNNGKYSEYEEGSSEAGGEFVGEGYAVSPDALTPKQHEGGIYDFTHGNASEASQNTKEQGRVDIDANLARNKNILNSFYDYEESGLIDVSLNPTAPPTPWNDKLYGYSDVATQGNSVKFQDYTEYAKSIFRFGLSFEKSLQNGVNSLMFNSYTPNKTLVNDITTFIDGHQGTILEPVPTEWTLGDTQVGYIGKQMVRNQRYLQSSPLYEPITNGLKLEYYQDTPSTIRKKGNASVDYSDSKNYKDSTQINGTYIQKVEEKTDVFSDDTSSNTTNLIRTNNLSGNNFKPNDRYVSFVGDDEFTKKAEEVTPQKNRRIQKPDDFNVTDGGIATFSTVTKPDFGYGVYDEKDKASADGETPNETYEGGYDERVKFNINSAYNHDYINKEKSLIEKTRKLFATHKIDTLIGRFHTSQDNFDSRITQESQTALSSFGLSHGRNLLKKQAAGSDNNYSNPYCRVWTYHHQYSKMSDLIRPFGGEKIEELQANYMGRPILGFTEAAKTGNWSEKTVLNKNGMVNIAPMKKDDGTKVGIKQCMFSLENLAWKDMPRNERVFPDSEVGPLGGRIMWFPPYDLRITETSQPDWERQRFIGRGETVYTYSNTERTGTLSFTIVADHPSVIDYWMKNHSGGEAFLDKDEAEQDLLRYFAGCSNLDLLEMSRQMAEEYKEKLKEEPKKEETSDAELSLDTGYNGENGFSFYLYFPNNLSGKDYIDNPDRVMDYLILGKHKLENIETGYTVDGKVWEVYDKNIDNAPTYKTFTGTPWGYETGKGRDSSLADANLGLTDSQDGGAFNEAISASITTNRNQKKGIAPEKSKFIWGYGKDRDTSAQRLCAGGKNPVVQQYIDLDDFGLNASRYSVDDKDINCSFMDAYVVIQLQNKNTYAFKNELNERILFQNPKLKTIQEVEDFQKDMYEKLFDAQKLSSSEFYTTNGKKYKRHLCYSVRGGASDHGYSDKNSNLVTDRRDFLKKWIETFGNSDWEYVDETSDIPEIEEMGKVRRVSDIKAKEARRARVEIWWFDEEITETTNAAKAKEQTASFENDYQIVTFESGNDYSRYGNEFEFFKELKSTDNILYRNIIDKIKFFDPAFHAITPEGFNGRLAFLHQCTRMGPTVESSTAHNKAGYAGNLAFGRAPVCVLRLGDFYNTRIVITSMNIDFDNNQWDLNPEGIGVQPMLAKVNLSFTFQGGSSLGGPVTRLQNAISFNYYANQEVYEDRADAMVYDESGNTTTATTIWDPWVEKPSDSEKYKKSGFEGGRIPTKLERLKKLESSAVAEANGLTPAQEIDAAKKAHFMEETCSTMGPNTVFTDGSSHEETIRQYEKQVNKNFVVALFDCQNTHIDKWVNELISLLMWDTIFDAFSKNMNVIKYVLEGVSTDVANNIVKEYYQQKKQNIFSKLTVNYTFTNYIVGKIGVLNQVNADWIIALAIYNILYEDVVLTDAEKLSKLNEIGYIIMPNTESGLCPALPLTTYNDKSVDTIIQKLGKSGWRDFLKVGTV